VADQFKHIIACLIMTSLGGLPPLSIIKTGPGLKKIPPYWYPYTTYAKERWLGREILEVVSTEFRDRSMEYYVCSFSLPLLQADPEIVTLQRYALESGVTTINGEVAKPDTVIQNGDRIECVHTFVFVVLSSSSPET